MTIETLFLILIAFQAKHFLADYPLQLPYMYENKGKMHGWVRPLTDHAFVHASITIIIVMMVSPHLALLLGAFDFATHFATDRWKASQNKSPTEASFWIDLGVDQMIHHLVGLFIVYEVYIFST